MCGQPYVVGYDRFGGSKLAEFKALSWNEKDAAVRKFVTEEKLATMLGEDVPAPGAIDGCVDAIKNVA
jgi:hypothetical protein